MSGAITWPARTKENDAEGTPDISVMMSRPLITLEFIETGVEDPPEQVGQREPLMYREKGAVDLAVIG
jgi:hypothetical protein